MEMLARKLPFWLWRRLIVHFPAGGDVWVLAIGETQASDSGTYICEVNTIPVLRSYHNLTGKDGKTVTMLEINVNMKLMNSLSSSIRR